MGNFLFTPIKKIKSHVNINRRQYLIASLVLLMGIILGVYLVGGEYIEDIIYTTIDLDLSDVVLGEASGIKLFFMNFKALIIPFVIIFVLNVNRFTSFLSYFYLGYQGLLLGASISAVVGESGLAGLFNTLLIILPINVMNLFVMISMVVVCTKRMSISRSMRLSFAGSIKMFLPQYLGCVLGAIFTSIVYAFAYPLLLKTAIVVIV